MAAEKKALVGDGGEAKNRGMLVGRVDMVLGQQSSCRAAARMSVLTVDGDETRLGSLGVDDAYVMLVESTI
jgi:hypothetical protein